MTLVHPTFDYESKTFTINSPIKTIYLRTFRQLTSDSNYYVSLHLCDNIISFTNKFEKLMIDGIELYQLKLFTNQPILPIHESMCDNRISLVGWSLNLTQIGDILPTTIEQFTDIYYETDENYHVEYSEFIHVPIQYIDCELTQKLRMQWFGNSEKIPEKNVDNVITFWGLYNDITCKKNIPNLLSLI